MKKLIYSALATGAALAVAFGANAVNVSADATPAPTEAPKSVLKTATYSLDGDLLTVSNTSAKQILVGVGKLKNDAVSAPATWDVYANNGEVKIDLSKTTKAKDAYLVFKADFESDEVGYVVKVPASDGIRATYDKKTGGITVTDTTKQRNPINNWTYRIDSQAGGVSAGSTFDKATYQMSGGVVYVSTPQMAGADDAAADKVLDKRPAKEAKLAIGKLANAPKIKANYVTGEITIPKNAYFRNYTENATTIPATEGALSNNTAFKVAGAFVNTDDVKTLDGTAKFAVDIQTAAEKDKKLASKIGHYIFPKQDATAIADLTAPATVVAATPDAKGKVTAEVQVDKDAKASYTVYWWAAGKETPNINAKGVDVNMKKTTVKPGATAKLAGVATKAGIAVQRIGNSKKGYEAWSGNIVKYVEGTNVASYAEPGTATAPGGGETKVSHSVSLDTTLSNPSAGVTVSPTSAKEGDPVTVKCTATALGVSETPFGASEPVVKTSRVKVVYTEDGAEKTVKVKFKDATDDGLKELTFIMPDADVEVQYDGTGNTDFE